jgi:hypothetical protein
MECDHVKVLDLVCDGNWNEAHKLIQPYYDELSCNIHAYLHQVEGHINNTEYCKQWFRHVYEDMPNSNLENELNRLYEMANKLKKNNSI